MARSVAPIPHLAVAPTESSRMSWSPYQADEYVDFYWIERWLTALASDHPQWVELREIGASRLGRPIWMIVLTVGDAPAAERPAVWIDAGTHASEFTGVSAALFSLSKWVEGLKRADKELVAWFSSHTLYMIPCISPDGYQAMMEGAPFLRSTLRPPPFDAPRVGFDPCDIDGDGRVRYMRFKHPAGPLVKDPELETFMRPRTLDDDPDDAYFLCSEGEFIHWDGVAWTSAPREFGIDLNRNFPAHWTPFSMFGMDAGAYPGSEPESRAVLDTFASLPLIGAALTYHTYTGCILTQPYRKDTPLSKPDIELMGALADDLVSGTGYKVFRVCPDFMYDPERPTPGVWSDTMTTVFGVPSYTVEFWSPFDFAGIDLAKPAEFFLNPDPEKIRAMLAAFEELDGAVVAWEPFEHPQLGPVEIGGLEYLKTVRNPPESMLLAECEKGHAMAERIRHALPDVEVFYTSRQLADDYFEVSVTLENNGFLPTSGIARAEQINTTPPMFATIELLDGVEIVQGTDVQYLEHLQGWGQSRVGSAKHGVYTGFSDKPHKQRASWVLHGEGRVHICWSAGRAGRGETTLLLSMGEDADV